jgi:dihydrofolate reductase
MINVIMAGVLKDENTLVIGDKSINSLPWHISEELKFFKNITRNHSVVMGYNTAKSLKFKALPNRRNFVVVDEERLVSNHDLNKLYHDDTDMIVISYNQFKNLLIDYQRYCDTFDQKLFIIGGKALLEYTLRSDIKLDHAYISYINPKFVDIASIKDPIEIDSKIFHNHFNTCGSAISECYNGEKFNVLHFQR